MAQLVTLYIEDAEIKLLVNNGKQVVKWASLILDQKVVRDGVILDEKKVAEEIKNLFEATGTTAKKVIIALSGLNSIFRVITLPAAVPQSMLEEAIINEAQRVLPISMDQIYLSYQRLSSTKEESRFFLVAHPRNSTDALIKTIHTAGLKPLSMDLAPLALARCTNEFRAVIVNSWLTYVDIIVLVEGLPQVIRTLSLPTDSTSFDEKLPLISEEIVRTIAFYNTSYPDKALDASVPLLVCGDLADNEEKLKKILGVLEHPIALLQPPFTFAAEFPASQYMVNIGMFLRGQLPRGENNHFSIIELNALPKTYQPPSTSPVRILAPVLVVVALLGLFWGWLMLQNAYDKTAKLEGDMAGLQAKIVTHNSDIAALTAESDTLKAELSSVNSEITAKSDNIVSLQNLIDVQTEENLKPIAEEETATVMQKLLNSLTINLSKANTDVGVITSLAKDTVDIVNVAYSINEATINGVAASEDNIFTYARALRNSGQFSSVVVSTIYANENSFIFTLVVTW